MKIRLEGTEPELNKFIEYIPLTAHNAGFKVATVSELYANSPLDQTKSVKPRRSTSKKKPLTNANISVLIEPTYRCYIELQPLTNDDLDPA